MAKQPDGKKVCYYELLGVDRKCEVAEIKLSYRKLALQMHPDKAHLNGYSVDEATKKFQQIQEAYSVLSDPQERTWYDAHREQILKGDDEPGEDPFKTRINLFKHFSTSCFDGFTDRDGGFFAVYGDLFQAINQEEAEWEDADDEHVDLPPFGSSNAEWADVANFYRHWLDFCSRKAFGFADKWNPRDATSRPVRRAMEQENKKARQAAKKEFNAEVRQLVKFVQKRDPRVAAHQKQQLKESQEKAHRESAKKEERKAAEAHAKQQRKEAARQEEQERWEQNRAQREARRARGEVVSEDEASEDEEEEERVEWYCEVCRKSFKSEKAFDQHCKSKKHLQMVAQLRRQLAKAEDDDEEDASDGSVDLEAGGGDAPTSTMASTFSPPPRVTPASDAQDKPKMHAKAEGSAEASTEPKSDESDEDEDSDDDAFLARFAAAKRQGAGAAPSSQKVQREDSEDEVGEEAKDDRTSVQPVAGGGSSKRQAKKEKHKSLLLEKRAEKEQVQSLVNAVKAAKAGRESTEATFNGSSTTPTPGAVNANSFANGKNCSDCAPANGSEARCAVCGEEYPSRTQLFKHIKETGHAALKGSPLEAAAPKSRKKKR